MTNFVKLSLPAQSAQHHAGVSQTAPSQHGMILLWQCAHRPCPCTQIICSARPHAGHCECITAPSFVQSGCSSLSGDRAAFDCQTYSIFEPMIKCVIVHVAAGQISIRPRDDQQLINSRAKHKPHNQPAATAIARCINIQIV